MLDYGAGNVRSVRNAIKKLGYTIKDVSIKFLDQVSDFIKSMVTEISKVRKQLGLKDGLTELLSESEQSKERKDRSLQKLLRNFPFLTNSQITNFFDLVWFKYKKAQI